MLEFLGIPVDVENAHDIEMSVKAKLGTDDMPAGRIQMAMEHELTSECAIHWKFYFHEGVLISNGRDNKQRQKELFSEGKGQQSEGKDQQSESKDQQSEGKDVAMKVILPTSAGKEGKDNPIHTVTMEVIPE